MADLTSRRWARFAVPAVLVLAVVVAVLLLGGTDDPEAGPGSPSPTITATDPPTQASPEEFCTAFRAFAEAQSTYVATRDEPSTTALLEAGDELLGLGPPLGLSDGGLTSLRELIDSAMSETGANVESPTGAPADPDAFNAYLATTCPA
ncbi:hypothetical protein ABFT23_05270 [Nocardioides sp. C4-1]|uniref:hypothetical protein n=1 Tax=Nocardioides sp. C4-1 TaxID=3151851 RepID=UPI003266C984